MTSTTHVPPRRYPRARVSFNVEVWVDRIGIERRVGGRPVVLGAGGAFLEVDKDYPAGTFLQVRFTLPPVGKIACGAIVRNGLEGKGVGVEFLDVGPHDRERITAFVEKAREAGEGP